MKILKIVLFAFLGLGLVVLLAGPIGPVPGVLIGGTASAAPAVWQDTSEIDEIRLKVPGLIPRVVIIWVIDYQGELHVVGRKTSGWVERIGQGAPVEMRLGDKTYALEASPVSENYRAILEAYVAKYEADYPGIIEGFPTMEEAPESVMVFRLDRR